MKLFTNKENSVKYIFKLIEEYNPDNSKKLINYIKMKQILNKYN